MPMGATPMPQQQPQQHPAAAPAAPQQAQLATLVRIISQLQRYEYAQYFLEPVPREVCARLPLPPPLPSFAEPCSCLENR